jgi:hypothetical protein
MRSGPEYEGGGDVLGEAGALSEYFSHREEVGTSLDLILAAVAAATGHRKMKGQSSKNVSKGVSKL